MTTTVGPIDMTGRRSVWFDFSPELAPGETLIGVDSPIEVGVQAGTDPSPESFVVGDPVIDGSMVKQVVQASVNNISYHLRAHGTTNMGSRPVVPMNLRVTFL